MPTPVAVALAALLTLSGLCYSRSLPGDGEFSPIIARPEKSDLYSSPRTRISGAEILERNPDLLRTGERNDETGFQLGDAASRGLQQLRHADLPIMRSLDAIQSAAIPEPSATILLPLSALLLLRRRRPSMTG